MGYIPSADTVYATAYLTETGRRYLFNENNNRFDGAGDDLFQITKFALSDSDTNYQLSDAYLLESGDVPDVTGKAEGCLKATANYTQTSLLAYVFDDTPTNVEYSTDVDGDQLLIRESDLPDISSSESGNIIPPSGGGGTLPALPGLIGPVAGLGGL